MRYMSTLLLFVAFNTHASGLYVGGQAGVGATELKETYLSNSNSLGASNVIYGAFFGYMHDLSIFSIGAEVDGLFGQAEAAEKVPSIDIDRIGSRGNVFGVHFLASIPMGKTADLYGRIGMARANFEGKETISSTTKNYEKKENGLVLGLGMKYNFDYTLAIRFDYRFTKYKEFKFVENGFGYKATDNIITLGLLHTF